MVAAQSNNLVLLENRILPKKNRRGSEKRTKLVMFEMRIVMEKKILE